MSEKEKQLPQGAIEGELIDEKAPPQRRREPAGPLDTAPKPKPMGARRYRRREGREEEAEEISERVLLAKILTSAEKAGEEERIEAMRIMLTAQHREGERTTDLYSAQRNFIYAQTAANEKLTSTISSLIEANIDLVNKLGASIVAGAEARNQTSTAQQVVEVIGAISQIPLLAAAQEALLGWLVNKKLEAEEKAKAKALEEAKKKQA